MHSSYVVTDPKGSILVECGYALQTIGKYEVKVFNTINFSKSIHHVNKVKNLKGKQLWELAMIAKKRKTLAVCKDCHHKIHHP